MRQPERDDRGFTLIELLIVIVVLGILAGLVVFALQDTTSKARFATCASERNIITNSLVLYRNANGSYPSAAAGLAALAAPGSNFLAEAPDPTKWAYDAVNGTVVGVGSCAALTDPSTPVISGTVTVFAATSLTNVFQDIRDKLTAASPGLQLVFSFGGSATLKSQINTGTSPADVFASADTLNAPSGPLVASSSLFTSNKLTIITRPGNPAGVNGLAGLFGPGLQVVLCQSAQPCGNATNQAFASIGRTRADLGTNLVSETANVGLVVTSVRTGAPNTVGVVYVTDALAAGSTLHAVAIPDVNNVVNHYPVYLINNSSGGANSAGAQKFIDYLQSSEGQALLSARGFGGP